MYIKSLGQIDGNAESVSIDKNMLLDLCDLIGVDVDRSIKKKKERTKEFIAKTKKMELIKARVKEKIKSITNQIDKSKKLCVNMKEKILNKIEDKTS